MNAGGTAVDAMLVIEAAAPPQNPGRRVCRVCRIQFSGVGDTGREPPPKPGADLVRVAGESVLSGLSAPRIHGGFGTVPRCEPCRCGSPRAGEGKRPRRPLGAFPPGVTSRHWLALWMGFGPGLQGQFRFGASLSAGSEAD